MVKHAISHRDSKGSLQLPLVLALVAITAGAMGSCKLLQRWRSLVELQLRLDRCVGQAALELKDTLEKIASTNQKIRTLRASILASGGVPGAIPPLQAALISAARYQDIKRVSWKAQNVLWLSRQKCGNALDIPIPLPALQWTRDPPDAIGPQPLRWNGLRPEVFHLEIGHSPRHAAAHLYPKGEFIDFSTQWHAEWAAPRFKSRTRASFH